jgi:catechol-2,3-dioxygenase
MEGTLLLTQTMKEDRVIPDLRTRRRRDTMTTGNIGFFEVHVDDFKRAQKFYHDVFGWEFSKSDSVPAELLAVRALTT